MKDQCNDLNFKELFPPKAAVTDNTAQVSGIIDMIGYSSATIVLLTGTLTDTDATFALTLEHGDDPALADTAAPAASDLIGTTALASFDFSVDNLCRKVGYIGSKRYIRATVTPANNTGNLFLAGAVVLGNPKNSPTSNPPV
ncbi:MAG: hypothetical protein V4477_16845 [Pseudomonadota bacterium]